MPGVGPRHYRALCAHFGSPAAALAAGPARLRACVPPALAEDVAKARRDTAAARREKAWLEARAEHFALVWGEDGYPETLAQLHDPPPVLLGRGDPAALSRPAVAIVGSRSATTPACDHARALAAGLGRAGLTVVSGLALGIDAAAHRGALSAGAPTVAVLGCGPDRVYPAEHGALARAVAGGGAVVSELPVGTGARPAHFPRRNRIIAGLTLATVVVEAGLRSGALITARVAIDHGRDVLAVPGSVGNPLARGCHALLKQGAGVVEDVQDVLDALAGRYVPPGDRPERAAVVDADGAITDPEARALLHALAGGPASLDQLVTRSGLTASGVSSMLLSLELDGVVSALPGGLFTRRSSRGPE